MLILPLGGLRAAADLVQTEQAASEKQRRMVLLLVLAAVGVGIYLMVRK